MPIDLGLARIAKLLQHVGNPHRSVYKTVHIAGTNGKGSTVSYISSILSECNIKNGKFTSPHLLHYNDCILINNTTYPLAKFDKVTRLVELQNQQFNLNCTEFEVLTVTAFKIFEIEQVEVAVIEVGLGGRLDATNVLQPPENQGSGVVVTGITKIGIDHEGFLGNTIAKIAREKAGIIKSGVPVVVDSTNSPDALEVIQEVARENKSEVYEVTGSDSYISLSPLKGSYQKQNLGVALKVVDILNSYYPDKISDELIKTGIANTKWPGRLQKVEFHGGVTALLDGAHNESAAIELGKYLDENDDGKGTIFVVAATKGKNIDKLLQHVTKPSDTLIATSFSTPEQMPWVSSYSPQDIEMAAKKYLRDIRRCEGGVGELAEMLKEIEQSDKRRVVICGSLYLCSDILRYIEEQ